MSEHRTKLSVKTSPAEKCRQAKERLERLEPPAVKLSKKGRQTVGREGEFDYQVAQANLRVINKVRKQRGQPPIER